MIGIHGRTRNVCFSVSRDIQSSSLFIKTQGVNGAQGMGNCGKGVNPMIDNYVTMESNDYHDSLFFQLALLCCNASNVCVALGQQPLNALLRS